MSAVYISTARWFHMYVDFEVFKNVSEKLHALPFIMCYEFNSVRVNLLIWKGNGQIYVVIIIISSAFVIILQHL
jgi:hypothetical protein